MKVFLSSTCIDLMKHHKSAHRIAKKTNHGSFTTRVALLGIREVCENGLPKSAVNAAEQNKTGKMVNLSVRVRLSGIFLAKRA